MESSLQNAQVKGSCEVVGIQEQPFHLLASHPPQRPLYYGTMHIRAGPAARLLSENIYKHWKQGEVSSRMVSLLNTHPYYIGCIWILSGNLQIVVLSVHCFSVNTLKISSLCPKIRYYHDISDVVWRNSEHFVGDHPLILDYQILRKTKLVYKLKYHFLGEPPIIPDHFAFQMGGHQRQVLLYLKLWLHSFDWNTRVSCQRTSIESSEMLLRCN